MEEEFAAVDQDLRDLTVRLSSLQQRQQSVEGRLADLSDQRRLLQQLEDDWKEAEDKVRAVHRQRGRDTQPPASLHC